MVNIDYLYNPDAARKLFNENRFVDKKLGFHVIENGMILPRRTKNDKGEANWVGFGGIVDSNSELIKESYVHLGTGGDYTPPPQDIQHSSETVIYFGISYPVWGHVITDNLRRIWFLTIDYFKSQFKSCPVIYIPFEKTMQKDFRRLLEILEVEVDKLRPITNRPALIKLFCPMNRFSLMVIENSQASIAKRLTA